MSSIGRRIRRHKVLTGSLAAALAALTLAAPSSAEVGDSRVVGPDGNLWVLEVPNSVTRITPEGDSTSFPLPAGTKAEALASGPGTDQLSVTTRPSSDADGNPSVYRLATSGTFSADPVPLAAEMSLKMSGARSMATAPDGSTWVSQGWSPCRSVPTGHLSRIGADGSTSLLASPFRFRGADLRPEGEIGVDSGGRLWIAGLVVTEVECFKNGASWSGYGLHGFRDRSGKLFGTACRDAAMIASDGAAWCEGDRRLLRMDATGKVKAFRLPGGTSGPVWSRPGPGGSIWFGTLSNVEDGLYVEPWTITSVGPDGELKTYPSLSEVMVDPDPVIIGPGAPALYDYRFTDDGRIWLLSRWSPGKSPLAEIIDLPAGVSHGRLPAEEGEHLQPTTDDPPRPQPGPGPGPAPQALRLKIEKPLGLSRRELKRKRKIRVSAWVSKQSDVRLSAVVTDRLARAIGLRAKKSRVRTAKMISTVRRVGAPGDVTSRYVLKLSRKAAKKLAKRRGSIVIQGSAEREAETARFNRSFRLR